MPPGLHRLCRADALDAGESAAFEVEANGATLALMLVRDHDGFHAYENRCPHTGAPLDWVPGRFLDLERRWIQCATHDALFEIGSGRCIHGPCVGQYLGALALRLDQGWVCLETPPQPG